MDEIAVYVVQTWHERYEYWGDVSEPADSLFGVPTFSYPDEEAARARLTSLREGSPTAKYRLLHRTTTQVEV